MTETEELVTRFHALEGITLSERRLSFNKLLALLNERLTSEDSQVKFLTSLKPNTPLEEDYLLDVLINFRRDEELMEVLKGGNPIHIRKVLRCWRFFESAFASIDERTLVNDILPHVSFHTRMKIINRLYKNLKNEQQVDAYFKALEEKYGLKVASAILPGCSVDFIKSIVEEYRMKLTSRHLLHVVKKDRAFLSFYLDILGDPNFSRNYQQVLKYVAKIDVPLYWELFDKHKLNVKFGRHMTPYVGEAKKDVVKTGELATSHFNLKQMMLILRKNETDFLEFFLHQFPKDSKHFSLMSLPIMKYLICVPTREKYQIFNDCFTKTFGKKLVDDPSCVTEDLLKIMAYAERVAVLDVKVQDDDSLIYLYSPKRSIPMLQDKIRHTSDMITRENFLIQLIGTCQICHDTDSLLDVLKYILFRHKNDLYMLIEIMRKLITWPLIEKLSSAHWECFHGLLKILSVSGKYSNREYNFMEMYLLHLLENDLPYDEHITAFLKYIGDDVKPFLVLQRHDKYRKLCLEHFATLIPQVFEGLRADEVSHRFLSAVTQYNKKHPKEAIAINLCDEMATRLTQPSEIYYYHREMILHYMIQHSYQEDNIYDSYFWDNYKTMHSCDMVIWYIKARPMKIMENVDKLFLDLPFPSACRISKSFRLSSRTIQTCRLNDFLKLLSKYSHLNIPERAIEFALNTLLDKGSKNADCALKILSHLAPPHQYFDVINRFDSPEVATRKKLSVAVRNLRNVNPPYVALPILLKLCTRKGIRSVQTSLQHIVRNTPEKMLPDFFNSLYQSSPSVRRRAISLAMDTSTKEGIYDFLKKSGAAEDDDGVKKIIFRLTLKYFKQNPSDMFWTLFKSNVHLINPKDRDAYDALLAINKIAPAYHTLYIPLIYELISSSFDVFISRKKYELLRLIPNDIIGNLDIDFVQKITKESVLKELKDGEQGIGVRFIFHVQKDKQLELLGLALDVLKSYVELNWSKKDYGDVRNNVSKYLREFCKHFITLNVDVELINEFQRRWLGTFKQEDVIEENLLLEFTSAYVGCDAEDRLSQFACKANEVLTDFVDAYDASVVDVFSDALIDFLHGFLSVRYNEQLMAKFFEKFCSSDSMHAYVVAIMVLVQTNHDRDAPVWKMIRRCNSPTIKMCFDGYLINLSNSSRDV